MTDVADHPEPAYNPANVTVNLADGDDPEDYTSDADEEAVSDRTNFSWTVKFTVSGRWVGDGFDLDHERAMSMLRMDLDHAYGHELDAQVLEAPPPETILAMQGGRGDLAHEGQAALDKLLAAAVDRARAGAAALERGETGAEDES